MQTSKTDKYVYHFVYFLAFTMAIPVEGLGPDYVISSVEEIQPQCVSFYLFVVVSSSEVCMQTVVTDCRELCRTAGTQDASEGSQSSGGRPDEPPYAEHTHAARTVGAGMVSTDTNCTLCYALI